MSAGPESRGRWWPNRTWAWPARGHHLLLSAALLPDPDAACAALRSWLAENDLDDAGFSEHRLLSAVAERLGNRLSDLSEHRRLLGIQRLNWTKSRMAVRENQVALEILERAGIKVVLLKGAARVALDPAQQKSRTSYDVDLLVAGEDFGRAAILLLEAGWHSARGESAAGLKARLPTLRARNLKKGRFGDLDLHRDAYRLRHSSEADDAELLSAALPVDYYGVQVFVPSPEERLAMAVAHGALDGAGHSDWLVDSAEIIKSSNLDWPAFGALIDRRKLRDSARIALGYLRDGIGLDIGNAAAAGLGPQAQSIGPRHWTSLLASADPETLAQPLRWTRGAVLTLRRARSSGKRKDVAPPRHLGLLRRGAGTADTGQLRCPLSAPPSGPGRYRFRLELSLTVEPGRRRAEFELTAGDRTLCFLRGICLRDTKGPVRVRFSGQFDLRPGETDLAVQALPGTFLQPDAPPNARARYAAIPFSVVRFRARTSASPKARAAAARQRP